MKISCAICDHDRSLRSELIMKVANECVQTCANRARMWSDWRCSPTAYDKDSDDFSLVPVQPCRISYACLSSSRTPD